MTSHTLVQKLLTVSITLTFLAGCSGGKETSTSKKLDQINIMAPLLSPESPGSSPAFQALEAYMDKKIHFTWVPNASYQDKFNIVMASGDLPHVIVVSDKSPGFVKSVKSGAFWELSPYLKDYKNLSQANEQILQNSSINGEVYGIYRSRDLIRACIIIRTDWLEHVGMEMPKTIDEFYQVLKAFKEKDPDQNGKDDTYGMVIPKWMGLGVGSPWDIMQVWFGAPNKYGLKNGQLIPDFTTKEYMDALRFFKKLYDEKLINPDFAVMDSAKWNDPVLKDKAGVIVDTGSRALQIQNMMKEANRQKKDIIDVIATVEGPNGKRTYPTAGYSGLVTIPKSSVKTEKELKEVLAFLDRLNDKEAQILINLGVEGRNYRVTEEGKYQSLEANKKALVYEREGLAQVSMGIPGDLYELETEQTRLVKHREEIRQTGEKMAVYDPTQSLISDVYTKKGTQLDNIILDARTQFIIGEIDEKGFQAAVDLWFRSGGTELMNDLNRLYEKAK
ncbi:extracellular solute-binding protein [Bacillus sp. NPDC077027]|uniref:extracellular solute-binding protein n=1 Tax=Bacillus sp. NPDC077027 TaxID=3390548 RepID=UPI003D031603